MATKRRASGGTFRVTGKYLKVDGDRFEHGKNVTLASDRHDVERLLKKGVIERAK